MGTRHPRLGAPGSDLGLVVNLELLADIPRPDPQRKGVLLRLGQVNRPALEAGPEDGDLLARTFRPQFHGRGF